MYKSFAIVLFIFLFPHQLLSQILPMEGSNLHYRLIGFSFPAGAQNAKYNLEIAIGNYTTKDSFEKHIFQTHEVRNGKIIVEVPSFGTKYTWRTTYAENNSTVTKSELHHFATTMIPRVDTNNMRFRLIKAASKYEDALVFLDGNKALYDMNGHPVWYLPNIEGFVTGESDVRDLKLTPQGTITFIVGDKRAYEINYDGKVLWKGPDNDLENHYTHYHHEFTRLSNGNYMILSTEPVLLKQLRSSPKDSISIASGDTANRDPNANYFMFPFGMLAEYDAKGNMVGSWKTSKYFDGRVPAYYSPERGKNKFDVHVNAFFYDQQNQNIYFGFRNISWIIRAQYPSGDILNVWGETFRPGEPQKGNDMFCGQHSIRRTADGHLLVYDNNACGKTTPRILMFEEPSEPNGKLKKVWEYDCTIDGDNGQTVYGPTIGGNIEELPDKTLFVSMSSPYGKVFMINRKKKILWSATAETYNRQERKWVPVSQYRASIIPGTDEIKKLIWGGNTE